MSFFQAIQAIQAALNKQIGENRKSPEQIDAKIRVIVKRILNKYGYPSDLQAEAVKAVLQQAELLCAE